MSRKPHADRMTSSNDRSRSCTAIKCAHRYCVPESRFGLTEIRIGLWPIVVFRAFRVRWASAAPPSSASQPKNRSRRSVKFGLVANSPAIRKLKRSNWRRYWRNSARRNSTGLEYIDRIRGLGWKEAAHRSSNACELWQRTISPKAFARSLKSARRNGLSQTERTS